MPCRRAAEKGPDPLSCPRIQHSHAQVRGRTRNPQPRWRRRVAPGTLSGCVDSGGRCDCLEANRVPVSARGDTEMPAAAPAAAARYDIGRLLGMIGDVPVVTDAQRVRLRSRDYFWYSPVLNKQLHGKSADVIAVPRNEADVIAVAAACAKLRIPAHLPRRRDRQLWAGGAARGRRAARSFRDEKDRVAEARHRPLRAGPEDARPRRRDPAARGGSCACIPPPSGWRRSAASSAAARAASAR